MFVLPEAFELRGAEIVQGRMHALLVIPENPGQHLILGLTNGFKALTVQSLHLQRSEQGFRYRVVPAVAFAAHGWLYAVPVKHIAKIIACILAATITVKEHLSLWRAPLKQAHLQGIDHQAAMHVRPQIYIDHLSPEQIDH